VCGLAIYIEKYLKGKKEEELLGKKLKIIFHQAKK
jgi:hypothetical protein